MNASPQNNAESNKANISVSEHLKHLIRLQGPISIAEFMRVALYHPKGGYYVNGPALGRGGDFITAPEISQTFGEMIGLWCIQTWEDMGRPASFHLIELGPGRGTLMSDILRAAQIRPGFIEAAQIALIETHQDYRKTQAETLSAYKSRLAWYDDLASVPTGPSIILANEFFDCLPIRQYVRVEEGWCERLVGLDEKDSFCFLLASPAVSSPDHIPEVYHQAPLGRAYEIGLAAQAIAEEIGLRLHNFGGRALIIDYGYNSEAHGDTLQALKEHKAHNPLDMPGNIDLTAHVDFAAIAQAAQNNNALISGPTTQGMFLHALGIAERAKQLTAQASDNQAAIIHSGIDRLISPEKMGELFLILALSSPNLPSPVGFPSDHRT